jgi:hypothetical protein
MADAPETTTGKGTVKLPGLGNVSKKALGVGAVVAGGVLAYVYYRHAKGSSSAAGTASGSGTTTGTVTDPAGNVCSALDPSSGYCPGTPEDVQYQESAGGSGLQDTGLNTNGEGDIDPETGYLYGSAQDEAALQQMGLSSTGASSGSSSTGTTSTGTTVTTNAEWEQECIANLESGGVAQATVTAAESGLPRYLAKLSLSSAQATAVQMCVGLTGPPPVGGPYNIIAAPAAPTPTPKPTPTPTPAATVTVPNVVGMRGEDATKLLKTAGFKVTQKNPAGIKSTSTTQVTAESPKAGAKAAKGSTVTITVKIIK